MKQLNNLFIPCDESKKDEVISLLKNAGLQPLSQNSHEFSHSDMGVMTTSTGHFTCWHFRPVRSKEITVGQLKQIV